MKQYNHKRKITYNIKDYFNSLANLYLIKYREREVMYDLINELEYRISSKTKML